MNNLYDNASQVHNPKPMQDGEQNTNPDNGFTESDAGRRESTSNSENNSSQEPTNTDSWQNNAPGISQFLKTEANSHETESDTLNAASVVQGVGHVLRNERLARKMSVEDVSRQLRISAHQVDAIEKEDFDALPGRTFVRGFVRNYANLMQLDTDTVLRMLPGPATVVTHVEHTPFKIQEMTPSSRENKGGGNMVQVIIMLVGLAVVGYFLFQKLPFFWTQGEEKIDDQDFIVQQGSSSDTVEMQLALPLPTLNLSTNSGGAMQLNSNAGTTTSVVTQNPINNLNTIGTLVFNFTADTHVRVIDGNDDIIFEQNNIRGTQQRVSGKRPLSVEIGNASAVELNYNDRVIDIKPYTHPTKGSANLMLE